MNLVKEAKIGKIGITVFTVLFALALMALVLLALTGCTVQKETTAEPIVEAPFDFIVEKATSNVNMGAGIYIITDNETGDRYMLVKSGYGTGLTKMED